MKNQVVVALLGVAFSTGWFWFIAYLTSNNCDALSPSYPSVSDVKAPPQGHNSVTTLSEHLRGARRYQGSQTVEQKLPINRKEVSSEDINELFVSICPRYDSTIAVVIPMLPSQLNLLGENLQIWKEIVPRELFFDELTESSHPTASLFSRSVKTKLIFYIYGGTKSSELESELQTAWNRIKNEEYEIVGSAEADDAKKEEEGEVGEGETEKTTEDSILEGGGKQVKQAKAMSVKVGDSFNEVLALWSTKEDIVKSKKGSSWREELRLDKLFEAIEAENLGLDYFFLMEPDCMPVKRGWLEKLYFESTCGQDFWIKGSPLHFTKLDLVDNLPMYASMLRALLS